MFSTVGSGFGVGLFFVKKVKKRQGNCEIFTDWKVAKYESLCYNVS